MIQFNVCVHIYTHTLTLTLTCTHTYIENKMYLYVLFQNYEMMSKLPCAIQ